MIYGTNGMFPIEGPRPPGAPAPYSAPPYSTNSATFGAQFQDALQQLNRMELDADQASIDLALGRTDDVLGAVMASERANLAMGVALKVRRDVLDAYEQIMRMSL